MSSIQLLYLSPVLLSVLLSIGLAVPVWRRRTSPGGLIFLLLMAAVGIWSLGYVIELLMPGLEAKVFWANVQYTGIVFTPVLWFLFCMVYSGTYFREMFRGWMVLWAGFPLLTLVLTWTDSLHHLMRSAVFLDTAGPLAAMGKVYGPWFWVFTAFSYLLLIGGTGTLVWGSLNSAALYNRQRAAVILAALLPWVGNALFIFGIVQHLDFSTLAFSLSGLIFVWGFRHWHLLEIAPVARDALIESLEDGVVVLDAHDRMVDVNPRAAAILERDPVSVIGKYAQEAMSNWPVLLNRLKQLKADEKETCFQQQLGSFWYDVTISAVYNRLGNLSGRMLVLRDVTAHRKVEDELRVLNSELELRVKQRTTELTRTNEELSQELDARKRTEAALSLSQERYALAATGANDGLWDWDILGGSVYYSARWSEIMGLRGFEMVGALDEWFSRIHPDDRDQVLHELDDHLKGRSTDLRSEHRVLLPDGSYRWVLARGRAQSDSARTPIRMAGSFSDITLRKQTEEQLVFNAMHDALTGLANRALFMDRLQHAIERVKRNPEYRFGVLYLDFDRFKDVNDSLGHNIGDLLLIASARRLESAIRGVDTVARLGGDEFVVLLDDVHSVDDATFVARRIALDLGQPFQLEGFEVFNSASIGIVMSETSYQRPEEVLRDADIAMYQAKQGRGGRYAIFDTLMREKTRAKLEIETDLRRAIELQQLELHYQPLVSLEDGHLIGFEALLRWTHRIRGEVQPTEFVHVAEETGIIYQLGHWVLETACKQLHAWQELNPAAAALRMNINVSARQLSQPGFSDEVADILHKTQVSPVHIHLEITETALLEESELVNTNLTKLHEMGVMLELDDFGTGYSSLSYLHRYQRQIDALKIDRSFVNDIRPGSNAADIVRTILSMATTLNLPVIAEGVETYAQMDVLQALRCQFAQGFLISRPLNQSDAEQLIQRMQAEA